MSQNIYLLSTPDTKIIADRIANGIYVNSIFETDELTSKVLISMAKQCMVEYFYVIKSDFEISFPHFDFSFKPEGWDRKYTHVWNNESIVRLFNKKEVLANPEKFTDKSYFAGHVEIKNINDNIYEFPKFDIIFISYDEMNADANYQKLHTKFPRSQRVKGVTGIFEAHLAAAKLSKTSMFYVVDADAEILPTFHFDYMPSPYDANLTHVWHSINPVNQLKYGYGAVKLFPTMRLLEYAGSHVDFTTTVTSGIKLLPEISNITKFNVDPFSAWKSGFRECVKLSSRVIHNQDDRETEERLRVWCSVGTGEFGKFAVAGAIAGREFGKEYVNQPDMLRLINDFDWLEWKFNS
jgi:hypothetical protein